MLSRFFSRVACYVRLLYASNVAFNAAYFCGKGTYLLAILFYLLFYLLAILFYLLAILFCPFIEEIIKGNGRENYQ